MNPAGRSAHVGGGDWTGTHVAPPAQAAGTVAAAGPRLLVILLLAAPLAIFNLGFLNPLAGIPAAALTLAALAFGHKAFTSADVERVGINRLAICFAVAALGCVLGGQGRFVYAVDDWIIRDAVMHDLIAGAWPPRYDLSGQSFLLRAPLGMYLVPAAIGKLTGVFGAHLALLVQNTLVLGAILASVAGSQASRRGFVVALTVFLAFSGLDAIGWSLNWLTQTAAGLTPELRLHIENWAGPFQYSSHITQLFWVPHHAIAGWAFAAFYLQWRRGVLGAPSLAVVFALCVFWSPLAMLGAVPLLALAGCFDLMRGRIAVANLAAPALIAAACLPMALYLVLDTGGVQKGLLILSWQFWPRNIAFLAVEVLPFYLILKWWRPAQHRFATIELTVVCVTLALLPAYQMGFSNDFAMRASIPLLALLALLVAERIAGAGTPGGVKWPVIILAIGAVTPALELARVVVYPAEAYATCNLLQAWRASPFGEKPPAAYLARSGEAAWFVNQAAGKPLTDTRAGCMPALQAPRIF